MISAKQALSKGSLIFNSDLLLEMTDVYGKDEIIYMSIKKKAIPKNVRQSNVVKFHEQYKPFVIANPDHLPVTNLSEPVVMPYDKMAIEVIDEHGFRDVYLYEIEDGFLVAKAYHIAHKLDQDSGRYTAPWVVRRAGKVTFTRSTSDLSQYTTELRWIDPTVTKREPCSKLKKSIAKQAVLAANYLHSLCSVLRAKNVTIRIADGGGKQKRFGVNKKKVSAEVVRIIDVAKSDEVVRYLNSGDNKGNGTKKAAHTRRSHIRRLSSGREIVIPACFVGAGEQIKQEYHF